MSIAHSFRFTIILFAASFALAFAMGFLFANAQEEGADRIAEADAQATQLAEQDENVTHEDLGVGDPNILPGSPLYALKNVGRGFQSFFTFDPAAKAELNLKFANEKISEIKKLEEGGADDERVKGAVENYEKETERVKVRIENLKDSGKTKEEIELIVKHTADSQIKHNKALGKMMQKRDDIAPEIEAAKAMAMKHFSESMATVVEPEVLQQKFEEAIKEQKGSAFRQFRNITVLEEVKDFVPLAARGAIQNAIENSSRAFEEEFQNTSEEQQKVFNKYVEKIGGNEVRHLEAFDAVNSFADIEKGMFEEMGKAREKTRARIEERMRGIKDETRKKVFVAHLEDAKMEDLRIVKELENNLAPETISSVLEVKHTMEQKMREKFENAQTQGDLDSFFNEIEDAPDVKMMEVMKEMEQIIPPDKKEFFAEMKKKAVTEMQRGLDEARKFGRLEAQLQQVSGFDPEHAAVLNEFEGEFGPQLGFFQDIQREQAERMRGRFEHFREFAAERPEDAAFTEEAEAFRLRIQQDPTAQANIQQFAPQISQDFQKFDVERGQRGFEAKDVTSKIENAQIAIQQLGSLLENASQDTPGVEAARSLLDNARKNLEDAQGAQTGGESGASFGQAVSAFQNATNGIRKLENGGFEAERKNYFEKRDEFREQFKGVPAAERPTFEAGVPVKPPSFSDFKFDRFRGVPEAGLPRGEAGGPSQSPDVFCAQAITPARHAGSGSCRTFSNACLPPGWVQDSSCEAQGEVHKVLPRFEIPETEKQSFMELEKRHLEEFKKHEEERPLEKIAPAEEHPTETRFFDKTFRPLLQPPAPIPLFQQPIPTTQTAPSTVSPTQTFDSGTKTFDSGTSGSQPTSGSGSLSPSGGTTSGGSTTGGGTGFGF